MKAIGDINKKVRSGDAVVVTTEGMIGVVDELGAERAGDEVDVVTTGTRSTMCSSAAFINVGHSKPRIKLGGRVTLNGVEAYAGLAAVELYTGATALPLDNPRNEVFPGGLPTGRARHPGSGRP